ncbi:MAG: hypothetical protein NTZ94_08620, partial [Verrucomicrobia bacterium]|nr:hypothetical protein [Verrucomicrobiota bacterium]
MDLGKPLAEITTLGTGGLLAPAQNPGSYAFLSIVDPKTRAGVVGGWLTHDRGSGVVFSPVKDDTVRMQAQIDYGCLRIKPGEEAVAETFAVGYFDDARFGLEAYADAIGKIYAVKLPKQTAGLCTWYMDRYAAACDEVHLPELVAACAKELKPFGFDFVQIDDDWQDGVRENGPKKNFTTYAAKGPYPSGMKATAENIKNFDLIPGIWFMPFAGNFKDPFFKDRQELFVKNTKGQPYETSWGGTCLDMTLPATQEFVRSIVARISHDWGYKFFKMDGFWTGSATPQMYVNDGYKKDGIGDAVFANPDKTNIEALRDGTKLVREAAGPDVFLLGCCVVQNMRSFGGTFGLLDAMRVGPDTNDGSIGSLHASRVWFLHGRVWWNDPDFGQLFRDSCSTSAIGFRFIPPTASTSSSAPSPLTAYQRDLWMFSSNRSQGSGRSPIRGKPCAATLWPSTTGTRNALKSPPLLNESAYRPRRNMSPSISGRTSSSRPSAAHSPRPCRAPPVASWPSARSRSFLSS